MKTTRVIIIMVIAVVLFGAYKLISHTQEPVSISEITPNGYTAYAQINPEVERQATPSKVSKTELENKTGFLYSKDYLTIPLVDSVFQDSKIEGSSIILDAPAEMPITDKLRLLARILSRYRFNNTSINVKARNIDDGSVVAVIDFHENDAIKHGTSWETIYIQGSTEGINTADTLLATFLQPYYSGPWIDAAEFYYNGKPFGPWEHIDLSGIISREEAKKRLDRSFASRQSTKMYK